MGEMKLGACLFKIPVMALLLGGLLGGGCATRYPYPPEATGQMSYANKYRIGPGDSLEIFVWRYPEVSTTATVRPDGYITARLLEDVPAAGKTPTELARDLEKELSVYLRDPLVSVIVGGGSGGGGLGAAPAGAGSGGGGGGATGGGASLGGGGGGAFHGIFSEQIRVLGEATTPRALQYTNGMTLLDLMIQVGGITQYADGNRTVLVRVEDGVQKEYTLRVEDLIKDGDITANTDMRPGDIVIIPESWF
jgi:polysaccharide biosynthesis/export protein